MRKAVRSNDQMLKMMQWWYIMLFFNITHFTDKDEKHIRLTNNTTQNHKEDSALLPVL